jgi:cell division protein FtsW
MGMALVIYVAHWCAVRGMTIGRVFTGMLPFVIVVLPAVLLSLRTTADGPAAVLVLTALAVFFVAGGNLRLPAVAAIGASLVLGLANSSWVRTQWSDALSRPAHIVGDWSWFGGWLGGAQLPDRMLASPGFGLIGEELGFVGAGAVLLLFSAIIWRGMRVALKAPDTHGGLLAVGVTSWIGLEAALNVAWALGLSRLSSPVLPLVSGGALSLVPLLTGVGILLSISTETVEGGWVSNEPPDRHHGSVMTPVETGPGL